MDAPTGVGEGAGVLFELARPADVGALLTASGWATYSELGGKLGGDWLEEAHEAIANAMLALVKLLAGIFGHSYALIADAVKNLRD